MKTDHISNARIVGGDYFRLIYVRKSNIKLEDYLIKFNFNDYWCYKATNRFILIETIDELKEFKYACYIFYKKELYSKDIINEWFSFFYNNDKILVRAFYLIKPFPPEYVKKLIKVI